MRLVAAVLLFLPLVSISSAADRLRIGLVLEGGGALGFAHIGVLQWFEANRIPIDAIAGTSMGGMVGGLYAAGETPQDISSLIGGLNWPAILRSQPAFDEIGFRRKEDRLAFPNQLEFGWRKGLALPSGLNSGQEVDSILDRALLPYFDLKSFDDLPIPFRCVATDLVSGKEKDFDRGSLAAALRATVSIPALFIPEDQNGSVYTDGGSLNNLPVDVAKRMNVDIVIAVYLDNGPPAADFQQSLLGIASRTASIMVAANEMRSIQLADILLTADVKDFTAADFTSSAKIIPRGFDAAQNKRTLLSRFSLAENEWQNYLKVRRSRQRTVVPVPEFVAVSGSTALEASAIKRSLTSLIGKPVDPASLENKLTNLNAQGVFDSLRYGIVEQSGKPGLGIVAAQKTNGPPFINFGLTIDGSDTNDVRFGLGARLTFLNAGGFRSEWRTDFAMGDRYEIASEYYHPFTGSSNWFVAPHAVAGKRRFDLYDNRNRLSEYSIHRAGVGLDLGYALGHKAEIRVGEELIRHEINLKLGAAFTPDYARSWGDSSARFAFFGQDDSVIPHKGINSQTRVDWFNASPFGSSYHSAETKSSFFLPVSQNGSLFLSASAGSAFGAKNLGLESFTLGGPFRLGAYGINELIGNQYLLFQGGYSHRVLTFNPLFGGAVYGLAWYEMGKIYGDPAVARLPLDGSVAIVAKTGLGPVFAGASMAATDRIKWWFGLGHVF